MNSTLPADSHYDDQGLFVSLIVGAALLVGFGGLLAFLHYTSILWLKRFYRPNHTVEPEPLFSAHSRTTLGGAADAANTCRSTASQSPMLQTLSARQTVFAEHTVRPHGRSGYAFIRRKRLGVSLPITSTFFIRPRLRDWISIEEPSLLDRKDGALAPVHYTTPAAPLLHTSDRSFVPIRTAHSPVVLSSPGAAQTYPAEYPSVDPDGGRASGQVDTDASLRSPRSASPRPSYGAVEPSSQRRTQQSCQRQACSSPDPNAHVYEPGNPLPKTPTDPLVAIYLFTLKYFLALMFFGEIFTIWIMRIASKDNYMRQTMRLRDIHGCKKQDDNETGCNALKPYCRFNGVALGCAVVPLHGIYDLTVSNIKPRSWRWAQVGLLNLGFCVVLVLLTLVYLRKVGDYVEAVMANQLRHALGYRVVCIRGLDTTDIRSENALRHNLLELSVYFPNEPPNAVSRPQRSQNIYVNNDSIFSEYHPEDDSYTICECPGLNCLFSAVGAHYYVVRREDATFTEAGKVEQILITREPPFGLLDTIADTESAMANLQEAIADEKALRRKLLLQNSTASAVAAARTQRHRSQRHASGGGRHCRLRRSGEGEATPLRATSVLISSSAAPGNTNVSSETSQAVVDPRVLHDEPLLMMRCSFPACCDKMPAVPYYESVFFKYAAKLNQALDQVQHQPVAGAAFVIFKDSLCAFEFVQLFTARFGGVFSSLTATIAGPPGCIFQNSLTAGRCALYLRFFLIFWVYIGLILTWSIPISFLGSLESLSQIPGIGRFLTVFTSLSSTLQSLLNAYLPVVVLALFNVALPYIIRVFVRMMGAFNRTECDSGQLYLQYVFMVLTAVIAQAAFQGAMNRLTDLLFDPNEEAIINFFIACVTPTNGYFYAKIISAACLSTWIDLLDPVGILKVLLLRGSAHIQRNYDALFAPCEFEFPRLLSFDLMILSMGLLFHMTAPLLGLLTVVYFFVRYWSQRAKQTDRYRPTLSPAHDCTDFGVPAQVIRSVMWLYCFAETCGVLLMGLRNHSGGVVLCSISLGTGIALTIYVYIKTRKWTASLACARRFADMSHSFHRAHPIRYQQRQQQQAQSQQPKSPTGTSQEQPQSAEAEPTVTPPLRGNGPQAGSRLSTCGNAAGVPQSSNGNSNNMLSPDNVLQTDSEDNAAERQLGTASRRNLVQEYGSIEDDEQVGQNQVLFDNSRNPFLSHLLPRKAGLTLRFQPKHQRLAQIDAAAEVRTMHNTNFVVERYWDRGMTWFEEDTTDRDWDCINYASESSSGDDDNSSNTGEDRTRSPRTSNANNKNSSNNTPIISPPSSGGCRSPLRPSTRPAYEDSSSGAKVCGSPLRIRTDAVTDAVVGNCNSCGNSEYRTAAVAAAVSTSTTVWHMSRTTSVNSATASKTFPRPPPSLPLGNTEEEQPARTL